MIKRDRLDQLIKWSGIGRPGPACQKTNATITSERLTLIMERDFGPKQGQHDPAPNLLGTLQSELGATYGDALPYESAHLPPAEQTRISGAGVASPVGSAIFR